MKFTYAFKTKDNVRHTDVIEAPSKDDVMAKGRAAFYRMRQAAAEAGMQDMSLDEINEEIRLVREGR